MSLRLITQPSGFPVTLDEVKAHIIVESGEKDALLSIYLAAATEALQNRVQKRYVTQTWEWVLQGFECGVLRFPLAPIASVAFVKYADENGDMHTVDPSSYIVTSDGQGTVIYPKPGVVWPVVWSAPEPVLIRFTVGTERADVPPNVKLAALMLTMHYFNNGPAVVFPSGNFPVELPLGVASLMLDEVWV